MQGEVPRARRDRGIRVSNNGADGSMITALSAVASQATDTRKGEARGREVVGRNEARGAAIKQRGREVVAVNACFGGNSLSNELRVCEFTGRRVEASKGITWTAKGLGDTSKGGKRGKVGRERWGAVRVVKAMTVKVGSREVTVSHKVDIIKSARDSGTEVLGRAVRERVSSNVEGAAKGGKEEVKGRGSGGAAISVESNNEGRTRVDSDRDGEEAAIRITHQRTTRAKAITTK